jgi:hypothetical protein
MSKHIKVEDFYRKNPLSHQPGGHEVTLYMANGLVKTYDKVKMPKNYIAGLEFKDDIIKIEIDGQTAWNALDPGNRYWEE